METNYHYIELENPAELKKRSTLVKINELIYSGIKTNEIKLKLNFVCDDTLLNDILDDFRKIKNRIAFNLDSI